MSGTLYALEQLQSTSGFVISALIGMLFGFFLEQAGFGSSRKLTAVFYLKDMTVVKTMFTALLVSLVGYHHLVVLGSIFFNEIFGLIRPVYEGMAGGTLFLYDSLKIPPRLLILALCLAAVGVFAGSTWAERVFGKNPKAEPTVLKGHAVGAALLVLFAGGLFLWPDRPATPTVQIARPDQYLREVAGAEDHLGPHELAGLLMKGTPGVILVDLRDPEEYRRFHIRGAVNIPLETLPANADAMLGREGLVVLYSNGTTHAAQAWLEMRHWGWIHVKVLMDGLLGFWRECLTPPSLAGSTDEQAAKVQWGAFEARRDFFLGKGSAEQRAKSGE
jgi:rhodanese-related sulfurtransferase